MISTIKYRKITGLLSGIVILAAIVAIAGYDSISQSLDPLLIKKIEDENPGSLADTFPPFVPQYILEGDGSAKGVVIDMPDDDNIRSNLGTITKNSLNYDFQFDDYTVGIDRQTNWEISVIDKFQDAYCKVRFSDKAGNETEEEFRYISPKFRILPSKREFFGLVTGDSSIFTEFMIINTSHEYSYVLDTIGLKHRDRGFSIEYMNKPGYIGGPFKKFEPLDSFKIRVWFHPTKEGKFTDSIGLGKKWAFEYQSALKAEVASPNIIASDINFYDVTVGDTLPKEFTIQNKGLVDLKIHAFSSTSFPFRTNLPGDISQDNPLILQAGQKRLFYVEFYPDSLEFYRDSIVFFSNATGSDSVTYINGHGVAPGLVVTSHDFGRMRIDRQDTTDLHEFIPYTHPDAVWLSNTSTDSIIVYDIEKIDKSRGRAFEFIESEFKNLLLYPRGFSNPSSKRIEVAFHPVDTGYHELIVKYDNSYGTSAQSVLRGIGVLPKLSTTNYDFDSTLLFDVLLPISRRVVFHNLDWEFGDICLIDSLKFLPEGSVTVDTSSEKVDWGSEGFKISNINRPGPPWLLEKGDSLVLYVNFVAQKEGQALAGIRLVSDALEDTTAYLYGHGYFSGIKAEVPDPSSCVSDPDTVIYKIENYGREIVMIDSMRIIGSKYLRFADSAIYDGFELLDNARPKEIAVIYMPEEVESGEAIITAYHKVSGKAETLKTIINTESYFTRRALSTFLFTNTGDSVINIGETVPVKIFLESGEDISDYRINDLSFRIEFNGNILSIGKDDIKPGKTFIAQGFPLPNKDSIVINNDLGYISFSLRADNGYLSDAGELFVINFIATRPQRIDSLYSGSIIPYISPIGKHCVEFYNTNILTINLNRQLSDNLIWKDFQGEDNRLLDVYPNPSQGNTANIDFEIRQEGEYQIKIFNSLGQLVEENLSMYLVPGKYINKLNLVSYAPGFYNCILINHEFMAAKKFIVIR